VTYQKNLQLIHDVLATRLKGQTVASSEIDQFVTKQTNTSAPANVNSQQTSDVNPDASAFAMAASQTKKETLPITLDQCIKVLDFLTAKISEIETKTPHKKLGTISTF